MSAGDLARFSAEDAATALAAACRLAYAGGLTPARSGNASLRLQTGFLCTPSGCCLGEIGPEDFVRCDVAWTPVVGQPPSSEWRLHARIYEADSAVNVVLHVHSPFATARALTGRDLEEITPEVAYHLGRVPCLTFAPPGTDALGRVVAEAIGVGARAALLERHGAVVWGASAREVFFQAELLETACALAYRTEGGGR